MSALLSAWCLVLYNGASGFVLLCLLRSLIINYRMAPQAASSDLRKVCTASVRTRAALILHTAQHRCTSMHLKNGIDIVGIMIMRGTITGAQSFKADLQKTAQLFVDAVAAEHGAAVDAVLHRPLHALGLASREIRTQDGQEGDLVPLRPLETLLRLRGCLPLLLRPAGYTHPLSTADACRRALRDNRCNFCLAPVICTGLASIIRACLHVGTRSST